mmetsp:Transcript_28310/g.42859  ORF Transcript_28310/g.42859 Transcript_28310/m.42859 type:complete len:82 (+) Transcript_28310:290-535(+)
MLKEQSIEENNKLYFQKKLNDRRKRTFDVLKQFDMDLAEIILGEDIPEKTEQPKTIHYFAAKIQATFRGWKQRKVYSQMLQ